ncbi:MAG TPA: hypothetical protein VH186_25795 [Chloroflexia bacterium]|nr:hypothetical protein [Chloroflexia bacterium]
MKQINSVGRGFRFSLALVVMLAVSLLLAACGSDSPTTLSLSNNPTTAAASTTSASGATTAATATSNSLPATTAASNISATTVTPNTTTSATGSGTPLAVPTVNVPQSVQQEMDKIAKQTEQTRRLTFKQPVERNFMTRNDLAKYQEEQFRKDNPPEEIAKTEKMLKVFGFVPQNFDLTRTYIDLLSEQILGFYDPETKKLYIVVDGDPNKVDPLVKFTAEHELTHGLQDQYFNLQKFQAQRKPSDTEWNDDQDTAKLALIEGDAVTSQTIWLPNLSQSELQQMSQAISSFDSSQLQKAPLILSESLNFPYTAGATFVGQLYRKGGWDAVNKAFTDYAPKSTSQILHPDKYTNKVEPVKVQFSSLTGTLGNGWKSLDINTMGEFQTRVWLQGGVDQKTATDAATGWTGDRYQVLENAQGQNGYTWRSQWENQTEASQFYNTSVTALKKIYNLSGDGTGTNQKRTWSTSSQDISITQKDNEVLITLLPKGTGVDKIASKLGF